MGPRTTTFRSGAVRREATRLPCGSSLGWMLVGATIEGGAGYLVARDTHAELPVGVAIWFDVVAGLVTVIRTCAS